MTIETKTAVRKLGDGSIPAAAALTGDEVVLGLQDGESVEVTTQDIADLAAPGGVGYIAIGSTAPDLDTGDPDIIAGLAPAAAWTRHGNGAGVPSAGDSVCFYGFASLFKTTSGSGGPLSFTVPLPFEDDPALPFSVGAYAPEFAALPIAYLDGSGALTIMVGTFDGESEYGIGFTVNYGAANAVDP